MPIADSTPLQEPAVPAKRPYLTPTKKPRHLFRSEALFLEQDQFEPVRLSICCTRRLASAG
jgi:hypothetical protein